METKEYPLQVAARDGDLATVQEILSREPKQVNQVDSDGRSALLWAVSMGHKNIVEWILQHHKPADIDQTDASGWTVVHIASSTGNVDMLNLILPLEPDVNEKANGGQTPLHLAVGKNRVDAVRLLLDHGAKPSVRIKDGQGQIPLVRAAANGSMVMVKTLLENGSPLSTTDVNGWTALHHAMAEGQGDVAVYLIQQGASSEAVDSDNNTPFDVAVDAKVLDYVKSQLA
ncbi:Ankyrin repeat-containing protein [Yarrowia sp. B02]|nr:Ankyrin repeat-containing protein [Yarrowia sp. B02]